MKTSLGNILQRAREGGYAVPAINIVNHLTLAAVLEAACNKHSPIIIQTSVATVKAMKASALVSLAKPMIEAASVPAVLHLDHCQSVEKCQMCCDLGWDSVMFDGSHLSLEENTIATRQVRLYAQSKGVDVEGEVGIIAGVEDDLSHDSASLAGFDDTIQYIKKTSVDAIAPAVGTAHGVYHGTPVINFELIERLAATTDCPIVIHGGTGLDDATFRKLIAAGASKINISTAVKLVYTGSMKEYLIQNDENVNPLKLDGYVFDKVVKMTEMFCRLFGSEGRSGQEHNRRVA